MASHLPVGIDSVVAYRACWRIGAVAVALHPAAGSRDLKQALAQAGPAVAITARELPPVPGVDPVGLDELTAAVSDTTTHRDGEPAAGDDAVVMFTSGSTGRPRGVVHTHGGLGYKVPNCRRLTALPARTVPWCRPRWPTSPGSCTAC